MQVFEKLLKVVQGCILCILLWRGVVLVDSLQQETTERRALVAMAPAALKEQAGILAGEIRKTRSLIKSEIGETRAASLLAVRELAGVVDHRAESIEAKVDSHLSHLDAGAVHLMERYERLPEEAAYANRWLWDCSEFSGCLQSQTLALVGSARATMGAVAKAAPDVAESVRTTTTAVAEGVPAIVEDSHQVVGNVKRLTTRRWYDRLLGVGAIAITGVLK